MHDEKVDVTHRFASSFRRAFILPPQPERFKKEPYLCLQLDASKPESRLLKCDLN